MSDIRKDFVKAEIRMKGVKGTIIETPDILKIQYCTYIG